tara:strand:- start:2789 stop:3841 length:1053 start_codon:yes stop_codon:yes gene_type:complete
MYLYLDYWIHSRHDLDIMKLLILWFVSLLPLLATPDWANKTNETFLGSNEKFYATFLTETDNQGSYYEWREIKNLNEYSKLDGTIISSTVIADILYTVDANHDDPNTQAKITRFVQSQNKDVLLSTILTSYHLPLIPAEKPEWINRLSWLNGNIMLDKKLVLVTKDILAGLKIPLEIISKDPMEKSILQVYSDAESIYLVFKIDTETDYNTHVLQISAETTKRLRDRINLLEEYVFIKSFKTSQEANAFGLEQIKNSQAKNFFGLNPEIWLTKVAGVSRYSLLHRPLELPIDPEQVKRLDAAIGINTSIMRSDHFVEKWIPYDSNAKPPAAEDEGDEEGAPEDLLKRPVK